MSLGERPATAGMRRVLCYCHPRRCMEAAKREIERRRAVEMPGPLDVMPASPPYGRPEEITAPPTDRGGE